MSAIENARKIIFLWRNEVSPKLVKNGYDSSFELKDEKYLYITIDSYRGEEMERIAIWMLCIGDDERTGCYLKMIDNLNQSMDVDTFVKTIEAIC